MTDTLPDETADLAEAQAQPYGADADAAVSPYGAKNENLPEKLVDALKEIVRRFSQEELAERRREIVRDRRNRFYQLGYQHIYEKGNTATFALAPAGGVVTGPDGESEVPNCVDDYNIYAPCLEILIAVLTQNPPGVNFKANSVNRSEDMEAAETAETYRHYFDRSNETKLIQTDIVRMLGLSGRTVLWTRTEADPLRFGINDDGTPRQMETSTVYGTLESRVPITAKSLKQCLYCFLYDDPHILAVKDEYPEFEDKIKANTAGLGEQAYERFARLGTLQGARTYGTGDVFPHLVTRIHCWLRPAAFCSETCGDDYDEKGTIKDALKQIFPNGCHIVFIGDTYVGSWDESLDDCIEIGFPSPGDGMSRPGMMERGIVIQDRFNDDRNAYAEVKDYGWPSRWVEGEEVDADAIKEQRADPYAIRIKKARSGQSLGDSFYQEENPEIPQTFVLDTENLLQYLYFMLATPPALFGQSESDQKTASGFAQMRAQAMGRLGLVWSSIQRMMARMYYQAALAASANPDHGQDIVVEVPGGPNATAQLQKLSKGKFGAYPDEDSSFPETTDAKRATIDQVFELAAQVPIGMEIISNPDNLKFYLDAHGITELTLIPVLARNKQIREIEALLQTDPLPPDPRALMAAQTQHAAAHITAGVMGGPEPPPLDPTALMESTVKPDEYDYHQLEADKCKEWLSSNDCAREIASGNVSGVLNVRLHLKEHLEMVAMQAPPPMPMSAPPGGKPGLPPPGRPLGAPNGIATPPGAPGAPTT